MSQAYSDPKRAKDPHALPDIEVFKVSELECNYNKENLDHADEYTIKEPGWYWWACFPGCLPDGDASGPYAYEFEAWADAVSENVTIWHETVKRVDEQGEFNPGQDEPYIVEPGWYWAQENEVPRGPFKSREDATKDAFKELT